MASFQINRIQEGLVELCFDMPGEKVNKLTPEALAELEKVLDQLAYDNTIQLLKFTSGKEGVFIAGADLKTFEAAFNDFSIIEKYVKLGHRVFRKLNELPFPTVACINGACLGGGLELALSCTYRIASDSSKTQIGLPEVKLGIFPGWGGTQRLPRLIGLQQGLSMILAGQIVPAQKAYKMGIVDALYPAEFFKEKQLEFIHFILSENGRRKIEKQRQRGGILTFLLEKTSLGREFLFWQAKKDVEAKTKGKYPAPLIALKLIKETCTLPLEKGLEKEAACCSEELPPYFDVVKNLMSLYIVSEAAKKNPGVVLAAAPRPVRHAAVIGAGTMGATIAWLLADHGVSVRLKDISWDLVGKGIGVARALFNKGLKSKKIKQCDFERHFQLISGTVDYSGFEHAEIIIEAATENLELKRKIFQELEQVVKPDAIIATNTSSLTLKDMAKDLKHPERFVAMHFFNPVNKMPLVEVVGGENAAGEAVATTVDLSRKLGKTPIVVGDCAGFLVNRIFVHGANELMLMFEEGYSRAALENANEEFGMPMDPFELADEVGVDVMYKVGKTLEQAYGERMKPAKLLELMIERGFYGKKNGKGFYIYTNEKREFNPEVKSLIEAVGRKKANVDETDIQARFISSMVNEASRCLEEKITEHPDLLDLSLIMGIGFPPYRGGLLRYADNRGIKNIYTDLKNFEVKYGMRFAPSQLIQEMNNSGKGFY